MKHCRRPTIGFLVDSIEESYQGAVFDGVMDAAVEADANVVCFCGGALKDPRALARNALYDLVGPENVDGLVVMSGVLGNVVGPDAMSTFCASFGLPFVSVAVAMRGAPSVVVDNATGIREAIEHVVETHARSRIAFIRGPRTNEDAQRRFDVYREALEAHDLTLDWERVVDGQFDRASGAEAVRVLLDERSAAIDAIVAASDEMAIGAIQALIDRGIRVPDEVAVVGFDDVETARFCVPPLTTVQQPLREQGRTAARLVLARVRGEVVDEAVVLHTRLVMRGSCGCNAGIRATDAASSEDRTTVAGDMAKVLGAHPQSVEAEACSRVFEALLADMRDPTAEVQRVTRVLEDALRARLASHEPVGAWQDAIGVLRSRALALATSPSMRAAAENCVHHARALTSRYAELAQRDRLAKVEHLARALNETSSALATSFDQVSLGANLREHLPRLGIRRAYVSIHRGGTSRLSSLFAMDGDAPIEASPASFPSRALLAEGLWPSSRSTLIGQPLFFQGEALGVVLLEMGERMGSIYETLRDQISASIKASALVQRTVEHDQERRRLIRYILDVTPDMQHLQPLADLYPKILNHAFGMLGTLVAAPGHSSLPHAPNAGLLAVVEGSSLIVRASANDVPLGAPLEQHVEQSELALVQSALEDGSVRVAERSTIIPLRVGDVTVAVVRLASGRSIPDIELLSTFANQASAAIRAMQLYEMAALDPLTGTHTRRFFDDWLLREVRASFRARVPVTVLMMDMDGLKQINDGAGHLVGDEALASIGKALREALRANDLVGRYGGDEFVVILPRTAARAADRVAQRIVELLRERRIHGPKGDLPLRLSIGLSTLQTAAESIARLGKVPGDYFSRTVEVLLKHADEALYRAKRQGGMQVCKGRPSTWPPTPE